MHVSLDSALGRQRRLNSVGESIIQIAPNPVAAYSLRSLTGGDPRVVRVRRSSDNNEEDFNVSEVNSGALVSFVGSGNDGLVERWYDQSGNDRDLVQTTADSQPKIVNSGSLVTLGGKPAIKPDGTQFMQNFDSVWDTLTNTAFSCFTVAEKTSTSGVLWSLGDASTEDADWLMKPGGGNAGDVEYRGSRINTAITAAGTSGTMLLTAIDVTSGKAFIDGVEMTNDAPVSPSVTCDRFTLFGRRTGTSGTITQALPEIIFFGNDQADNRGAFEANMAVEYSITAIPTAADPPTVNGFVETWYDQSGNNRPLIQTTAANQPLIVESGVFLNGVKANEATSDTDMMNLRVSTDGTTANFGTDDWASGASSKLGLIYVGTVLDGPNDENDAVVWGGGRGVNSYQAGGLSLQVIKAGTDNWKLMNEREGLSPEQMSVSRTINTDADVVWYGTANNRDFTVNVNGSENTDTESADLDVREDTALSLFGAFGATGPAYYQRSSKGVCKECFLYAGDNITNVPAIATKINEHYSIY